MSKCLPITVVIPTKNEKDNLPTCLARLADAFAEVIVVDSGSDDGTCVIAKSAGAKLVEFKWSGGFPKKRNWMLLNYEFKTPWVLFLDADERVTEEFKREASAKILSDEFAGFWLNYRNYFEGKILKHGLPQRKLALFRVGAGLYERIDDPGWSALDMEVHEHPILEGRVGEFVAAIDHVDYRGLHRFIERHNDYSTWEANRYIEYLTRNSISALTDRQAAKYRFIDWWWFPLAYFFFTFVWKRGFLDGRSGLSYAVFKAFYFFQIRGKIREARKLRAKPE
jgi:glycosyltransferase involved in cell wall biosynthesis